MPRGVPRDIATRVAEVEARLKMLKQEKRVREELDKLRALRAEKRRAKRDSLTPGT